MEKAYIDLLSRMTPAQRKEWCDSDPVFNKFCLRNFSKPSQNPYVYQQGAGSKGPEPKDKNLYEKVKKLADKKFENHGIYKSSWIVHEYKRRGGQYIGSKPKNSGLKRWYKEEWIDLNRPIRNSHGKIIGYNPCGRTTKQNNSVYPLCRPSKRMSRKTPRTYSELSKLSINKAKRDKSKVKGMSNIKFGGGSFGLYQCDNCDYASSRNTNLIKHKRTHTGEKPHKCDFPGCNYASSQSSNLNKHKKKYRGSLSHKRKYTGDKAYKCDFPGCDYSSSTFQNVKTHKLIHTGEKPYKCDFSGCNYASSQSPNLKRHKLKHTGEKPYKCNFPGCDFAAASRYYLIKHKKTQHSQNKKSISEYDAANALLQLQSGSGKAQYRGRRSSVMVPVPKNVICF